jgi:hypothetical protein
MVKFIGILCGLFAFFDTSAMADVGFGVVFANHTTFSYTVDASNLYKVALSLGNQINWLAKKVDYVEVLPTEEKEFTLWFENRREIKSKSGELIDYGKIIIQKLGESNRHIADITFSLPSPRSEHVYPSLNGDYSLREFVDPQREFAITNLYMPRARKWGKHFVFSVEKFEEGKDTYIDLDQFYMTTEELEKRDRKRSRSMEKNIGCCGFFSKKRSGK